MRITISGKNIDVTQGLKDTIYEKLGKLDKYFTPETEAIVTLSVEKNRQKIEVTVPIKGSVIRAEQVSDDMYVSIDLVQEIIERQMRKHKTRLVNRNRGGGNFQQAFIEMETEEPEEIRIVRSKKFAMKPMDPEEACIQMELSGHNFFVFRNAETDDVNVVYKRKGNTYGLNQSIKYERNEGGCDKQPFLCCAPVVDRCPSDERFFRWQTDISVLQ